jgi:hypothetical protein
VYSPNCRRMLDLGKSALVWPLRWVGTRFDHRGRNR